MRRLRHYWACFLQPGENGIQRQSRLKKVDHRKPAQCIFGTQNKTNELQGWQELPSFFWFYRSAVLRLRTMPTTPVALRAYEQWRLRRPESAPTATHTKTTAQSTSNYTHHHNSRIREQLPPNTMEGGTSLERPWHLPPRARPQLNVGVEVSRNDRGGPTAASNSGRWEWLFPWKRKRKKRKEKKRVAVYQGYSGDWTF